MSADRIEVDGPVVPSHLWTDAVDDAIGPLVVVVDGQPMPLVEWMVDESPVAE